MTTITVKIEKDLEKKIKDLADESGMSPDDIVRDALNRKLNLYRFKKLQGKMSGYAQKAGYESEEEVLDDVS